MASAHSAWYTATATASSVSPSSSSVSPSLYTLKPSPYAAWHNPPADTLPAVAPVSLSSPSVPVRSSMSSHPRGSVHQRHGTTDYSEEELDTVETADIDVSAKFEPDPFVFVPSSSVHNASVGKLDSSKRSQFGDLFSHRMRREQFEEKFHHSTTVRRNHDQIAEHEAAVAIDMRERGARLGALLASRPSRSHLESQNIIKTGGNLSATANRLAQEQTRNRLSNLLQARPNQSELEKRRIIHTDEAEQEGNQRKLSAKSALNRFLAGNKGQDTIGSAVSGDASSAAVLPRAISTESVCLFSPVEPLGRSPLRQVTCSFSSTLVLDASGNVFVIGNNSGVPPGRALSLGGVSLLRSGDHHHLAIATDGAIYTWGVSSWGRLGIANTNGTGDADVAEPTKIASNALLNASAVVDASLGAYHSIVLTQSQQAFAFGWNKNGRCGVGKVSSGLVLSEPIPIPFFSGVPVKQLACGQNFTLALGQSGQVFSWGAGAYGGLGHGDEKDQWEPKEIDALRSVTVQQIGVAAAHSVCVASDGRVFTFGLNKSRELGRATEGACALLPAAIEGFDGSGCIGVACGKSHTLLLQSDGAVYTWGFGGRGVCGHGDENDVPEPKLVNSLSGTRVIAIAASWAHSALISADGQLFTCGSKKDGKLGNHDKQP